MVIVSVHCNAHVADTVHVPGVDNTVYDGLSRGKTATEVGLDPAAQMFLTEEHPIWQFMALCDPAQALNSLEDCLQLAGTLRRLLESPPHATTALTTMAL
jgi:hypothetical protein